MAYDPMNPGAQCYEPYRRDDEYNPFQLEVG